MPDLLTQTLYIAGVVLALALVVIGLPGTFVIVITAFIYGYTTGFENLSVNCLLLLLSLSVFAELADNLISMFWARRYGSSARGIVGSIIGALIGSVIGSALLPIIGTILGGLLGSFVGAYLSEYHRLRDNGRAVRAGWGAFAGRMAGIALKLLIAAIMAYLFLRIVI
jgi:uncharacterized protein